MRRGPGFRYVGTEALHVMITGLAYWAVSAVIAVALIGIFKHDALAQVDIGSSQPIVQIIEGDEWYFFKGQQKPPLDWNHIDFNMSNWQRGLSGIGYGISVNRTYLGDMQGNYLTVYAGREFFIDDPLTADSMTLSVLCDGPFVAYLNGVEMIRTKTVQESTLEFPVGVADIEQYNVSGFIHELVPGRNVLSVQCDNDDITSPVFSFIPVFEILEKGRGQ